MYVISRGRVAIQARQEAPPCLNCDAISAAGTSTGIDVLIFQRISFVEFRIAV